ncbi:MAG: inorganic phosphate transporter, partial [Nitrospirales bacterium]
MESFAVALLLVLALAFANGSNDVSKAIATLVGSGVTNLRGALLWGTCWTVLGAVLASLAATAMLDTFSTGLLQPGLQPSSAFALGVLVGSLGWVLLASWAGLPVSTTHAITGSIVGASLVAFDAQGILWSALAGKIVLPLLVSPVLALGLALFLHSGVRMARDRWEGTCLCVMPAQRALVAIDERGMTRTLFQASTFGSPVADVPAKCERAGLRGLVVGPDSIHWMSSGLTALARGMNDTPKILAMLLLGGFVSPWA